MIDGFWYYHSKLVANLDAKYSLCQYKWTGAIKVVETNRGSDVYGLPLILIRNFKYIVNAEDKKEKKSFYVDLNI